MCPTPEVTILPLRSLAPHFKKAHHGVYVDALIDALRRDDGIRNIALTGAYGTGKSSVLQRLTELEEFQGRVLELSLSTVGVAEERPEGESDANPAAWTKVNLIQKEIVKQILYRDPPEKTRGSRFRRLSKFRWLREIWVALCLASLLLAIGWVAGLTSPWLASLGESPHLVRVLFATAILLVILAGVIFALRWLTHNRVFLEKLSAGPATVSLAPTSSSFFDQYMDEIIYYFEKSRRDIVIFEDIDRFEDVHIFETLRALNTLLNSAEQLRGRRRPKSSGQRLRDSPREANSGDPRGIRALLVRPVPDVKFIYALRDSVFEKIGDDPLPASSETLPADTGHSRDGADDEIRRANRTKFFDIVIPIVPFITHRNARDLMLTTMKGTEVSRDLINVAARFVADMRLIIDLRNEYDIYANRLLSPPSRMPGLDPDRLFALILYKCVHMADFEAIRLGTSNLDKLHEAWRVIVADSLKDAYSRERKAITDLEAESLGADRAAWLGERLESVAHAVMSRNVAATGIAVNGQQYQGDQLRQTDFWLLITAKGADISIFDNQAGQSLRLSLTRLQTLLGQPVEPDHWRRTDAQAAREAQRSAREDISFLRHHNWGDLHDRPEFKSKPPTGVGESLAEATDRILQSRLARTLVATGYLDDYFALYVSVYYGEHLRPRALNYSIHALDRGVPDLHYVLDGDDVEAIVIDKGIDIFRDRAAYNISLLDYLLSNRPSEAEMLVRHVATWDVVDRDFAEAYLLSGTEQVKFIRLLAPLVPTIITSFVLDTPRDILAEVMDAALDYAGEQIEGTVSNQLIIDNYQHFPSISTAARMSGAGVDLRKHRTIEAIAKLGIQLPATAHLDQNARSRVVILNAYQLNEANIADLTDQKSLALDAIRAKSKLVYNLALARAGEYIALVLSREDAFSIVDPTQFLTILHDADSASVDEDSLAQIIECASPDCRVERLTDAPRSVWSTLAASRRLLPSTTNLLVYLDHFGSIDEGVAKLLDEVEAITQTDDVADAERARLALAILKAADPMPSAEHRVRLAVSLELSSTIRPDSLIPEVGALPALLLQAALLSDDEATFSSALMVDWATREAAFAVSQKASEFISPISLPPQQLAPFFNSGKISQPIKTKVLSNISEYISGVSTETVLAIMSFAIKTNADFSIATINQLREAGAPDQAVVALLVESSSVTLDEIQAQLRHLGEPYPTIAARGTSRPLVPDDPEHRRLLDRLQDGKIVSKHEPERAGRRVYLRRPPAE